MTTAQVCVLNLGCLLAFAACLTGATADGTLSYCLEVRAPPSSVSRNRQRTIHHCMLESVIRDVLSKLPGAEDRPQQLEMARLIQKAIRTGRHALIEAGTGSGKSFGYLLPI